jgi:hypothetical protein
MFTDDKFKVNFVVDKRGRPVVSSSSENMKKFYDLNEPKDKEAGEDEEKSIKKKKTKLYEDMAESDDLKKVKETKKVSSDDEDEDGTSEDETSDEDESAESDDETSENDEDGIDS